MITVLEFERNACAEIPKLLWINSGVTYPVFLVGKVIKFYRDPELRLIVKYRRIQHGVFWQNEGAKAFVIDNFIIACIISAKTRSQTF